MSFISILKQRIKNFLSARSDLLHFFLLLLLFSLMFSAFLELSVFLFFFISAYRVFVPLPELSGPLTRLCERVRDRN